MATANPMDWLLEQDPDNPSIRYWALRDLLDAPEEDADVRRAGKAVMMRGPVPRILAAQQPDGSWIKKNARYQSTATQVYLLAELGASSSDKRVRLGCEYLMSHGVAANGALTAWTGKPTPSRALHCHNSPLAWALTRLEFGDDERVRGGLEWQVEAILGRSPSFQYYKSGTSGPDFACAVNLGQPCGWGAVKALRAFAAVPKRKRTAAMREAIHVGAEFLLSHDLTKADYPYTVRISSTWFKFGFPLSYWSDVLEATEALVDLGYARDPRLASAYEFILTKRDADGRWKLENSLNGKMWADIEVQGRPSKWITFRAMRVFKRAGRTLA